MKYGKLTEVQGRLKAEMLKSYLEAHEIDVELIQESIGYSSYSVTVDGLGQVQLFVPKEKLPEAREWINAYREGAKEE